MYNTIQYIQFLMRDRENEKKNRFIYWACHILQKKENKLKDIKKMNSTDVEWNVYDEKRAKKKKQPKCVGICACMLCILFYEGKNKTSSN